MTDNIIPNVVVSMPSQLFTLARSFKAAANGRIYIGKIDTDPTIPENQIQVYLQNEDGSTVPISQPIMLNTGGYPVYGGQIAKFVTVQGHSMAVYDAFGVQQFYFHNVLKYDPDQLRQELAGGGGAELIGYQANPSSRIRSVANRLRDIVSLHDYYFDTDMDDWSPALNRALSASNSVFVPVGRHELKTQVTIPSNKEIFGNGLSSILASPAAKSPGGVELITALVANNATNITLRDFYYDGGCSDIVTTKRPTRGIRFRNCSYICVLNCEVSKTADWALSFEFCNNVIVKNYKHRKSTGTLYGGRDGLHFLDCVDYSVDGADIESGDDMVGCTTETRDQRNATIRNVSGYSMIASGVIFNEEGATTFSTVNVLVDGVNITFGKNVRNVVRVQSINPETNTTGVIVKNVRGVSYSHGLFIAGQKLTKVTFSDIDVSSTGGHGIYINSAQDIKGSGRGASQASSFDGWNLTACKYFNIEPSSLGSAGWGCQILNCSAFTMNGNIFNCGAGLFASSRGGNCRISNSTNYYVTGVFFGDDTTSYYGLSSNEVPTGRIADSVVAGGAVPKTQPRNFNALQIPVASCAFGQSTSGSINVLAAVGCSVALESDGRYRVTFNAPFSSTFYRPDVIANRNGARLMIEQNSRDVNGFTFSVKDTSGAIQMANFINCNFTPVP